MATVRTLNGGDAGTFLDISCVPDSTFKDEIAALIALETAIEGKLVSLTFSNNYEVTSPADEGTFDGEVLECHEDGTSYVLTVRLFNFTDQNGNYCPANRIKTFNYASGATIALQDTVEIDGSTYMCVQDGGAAGFGAVISKNTTELTVDVLM